MRVFCSTVCGGCVDEKKIKEGDAQRVVADFLGEKSCLFCGCLLLITAVS